MTDQEIDIAIAEACGWTNIEVLESNGVAYGFKDGKKVPYKQPIPNFSTDLNVMHEAENVLVGGQRTDYLGYLYNYTEWNTVTATARQRAEAFLRTKGLWKENT